MRGERRGREEEIEEQEGGETDQAGKNNYLIGKIIKGKIKHQEDIILNIYVSNTRALKFVKKKKLEKKVIYCPKTLKGRDFNTSLLPIYRLSRQKLIEKC